MLNNTNFKYDNKYDVMYIYTAPNEPATGVEDEEGIIVRYSIRTNECVGVTIFDFKYRIKNNLLDDLDKIIDINYLKSLNVD